MMTKTEMEDAIKNCNHQLSAIEQILPTLATKQDLERYATRQDLERYATKEDLREGLAGLKSELLIRFETLDGKFDMLADGFASHTLKIEKIERIVESHDVKLDVIGTAVRTLTERLERKGVI